MARLEAEGVHGSFHTVPNGFPPETLPCILTLLGVPRDRIPRGRAWLEAVARGMAPGPGDLAVRCSFVRVEEGLVRDPCCRPPRDVAERLMAQAGALGGRLERVGPYKCLQTIPGGGAMAGMGTFPPHQHRDQPFAGLLPRGNPLAEQMAALDRESLARNSPYALLHWGQAGREEIPPFSALHGGARGGAVCGTDIIQGAALAMGMELRREPGFTGDTDTCLEGKLSALLDLSARLDVTLIHLGGTDEATHRRDPKEKAAFVGRVDRELLSHLMKELCPGDRLLVCSDHAALCRTGGHSGGPVEFRLWTPGGQGGRIPGVVPGGGAISLLYHGSRSREMVQKG